MSLEAALLFRSTRTLCRSISTHLLLEIGYDQDEWHARQADATAGVELVEIVRDLAGLPRTAVLRRA